MPTDRSQNNLSKLPYLNKIKKDNSPIGDTPQGSIKNKFPEFRFNSQQITNPDKKFQNLNFISPARPSLLTNLPEKNVPQYNLPMSQGNQGRESTSEPNQVDNFYDDLDQPDPQQKHSDPFLTRQAIRMPSKVQLQQQDQLSYINEIQMEEMDQSEESFDQSSQQSRDQERLGNNMHKASADLQISRVGLGGRKMSQNIKQDN